jgi:hypothetical protein
MMTAAHSTFETDVITGVDTLAGPHAGRRLA